MCDASKQHETHFEVFRNAQWQLRATSPYCTASVTNASTEGDFKTRRGLHLNLRMEDLQDAVTERGRDAVVQEIGSLVFALLDTVVKEERDGKTG